MGKTSYRLSNNDVTISNKNQNDKSQQRVLQNTNSLVIDVENIALRLFGDVCRNGHMIVNGQKLRCLQLTTKVHSRTVFAASII